MIEQELTGASSSSVLRLDTWAEHETQWKRFWKTQWISESNMI